MENKVQIEINVDIPERSLQGKCQLHFDMEQLYMFTVIERPTMLYSGHFLNGMGMTLSPTDFEAFVPLLVKSGWINLTSVVPAYAQPEDHVPDVELPVWFDPTKQKPPYSIANDGSFAIYGGNVIKDPVSIEKLRQL